MKRIESTQNALVKYWKKLATTRKERERSGEFIVEGFHLVEEALKNNEQVQQLIVREGVELPMLWPIDSVSIVEVTAAVAKEFAETETSQGVFAVCKQPLLDDDVMASWRKVLLIDAVQDPGNIGTMIRTADAAGLDAVILGKGCADLYNPKTLRSAQGSHFHIPVLRGDLEEWIEQLQDNGVPVFGTALDEDAVIYSDIEHTGAFAIMMGNEGSGIHPQLLSMTDQNIIIPILGQAESLNVAVATGIVLYGFVK
ncbi:MULTISPECIES: RNA methyltransferase [unclassified Lysinibacillus]|uniref:TrmH family RNA methyltransferase n=1 Tax=unclassified Lysinibacillus TaxID=2636778 RepID=UPI00201305C4|nr:MULTISPECIES: RNA methyltransferase [unclassified Lysinibacillus]MCL1695198.1 RNA methyltransferase [Lysinibacillus sp. BPa_S21]MCL1701128.1 RNA methyltransferase [Lysinibacillus sp. Bpr_S20]